MQMDLQKIPIKDCHYPPNALILLFSLCGYFYVRMTFVAMLHYYCTVAAIVRVNCMLV